MADGRATSRVGLADPPPPVHRPAGREEPRITIELALDDAQVDGFYDLYTEAFAPLRTQAAARQVLNRAEFDAEMSDPRVWKYVGWDRQGRPQALTTLTQHLETVPWISPEFFAARYPDHTARNAVYYLGFVLSRPQPKGQGVLFHLLSAVIDQLAADKAICGFDMCAFNNATLGLDEQFRTLTSQLAGATSETTDTQTYYSTTFT